MRKDRPNKGRRCKRLICFRCRFPALWRILGLPWEMFTEITGRDWQLEGTFDSTFGREDGFGTVQYVMQ